MCALPLYLGVHSLFSCQCVHALFSCQCVHSLFICLCVHSLFIWVCTPSLAVSVCTPSLAVCVCIPSLAKLYSVQAPSGMIVVTGLYVCPQSLVAAPVVGGVSQSTASTRVSETKPSSPTLAVISEPSSQGGGSIFACPPQSAGYTPGTFSTNTNTAAVCNSSTFWTKPANIGNDWLGIISFSLSLSPSDRIAEWTVCTYWSCQQDRPHGRSRKNYTYIFLGTGGVLVRHERWAVTIYFTHPSGKLKLLFDLIH